MISEVMPLVSWLDVMTSGRRKKARCLMLSVSAAINSCQKVFLWVSRDDVRDLLLSTGKGKKHMNPDLIKSHDHVCVKLEKFKSICLIHAGT